MSHPLGGSSGAPASPLAEPRPEPPHPARAWETAGVLAGPARGASPFWNRGLQAGRGGGGCSEAGGAASRARTRCPGTWLLTAETRGPQERPGRRMLPDLQQSALPTAPTMASNTRFALPMDLRLRVLASSSSPSCWAARLLSFARHLFSQDGALQNLVTNLR